MIQFHLIPQLIHHRHPIVSLHRLYLQFSSKCAHLRCCSP